jgi:hypothetical protein
MSMSSCVYNARRLKPHLAEGSATAGRGSRLIGIDASDLGLGTTT